VVNFVSFSIQKYHFYPDPSCSLEEVWKREKSPTFHFVYLGEILIRSYGHMEHFLLKCRHIYNPLFRLPHKNELNVLQNIAHKTSRLQNIAHKTSHASQRQNIACIKHCGYKTSHSKGAIHISRDQKTPKIWPTTHPWRLGDLWWSFAKKTHSPTLITWS